MLALWQKSKTDNSNRSSSGHLKYFRRVHWCSVHAEVEGSKTRKIDEFYGPVEKRPRVGTLPDADIVVNVEEKTDLEDLESGVQTSLNPLDLQFVFPDVQSSVPDESPESETDEHPVEVITCTDQRDDYRSSESGDSESEEDCADDRIGFHMVMSTRAGRERVFTTQAL